METDMGAVGDKLSGIMEQETALLKQILPVQNTVRQAVENHEWTNFEVHMAEINALSGAFEALEAEREWLLAETFLGAPWGGYCVNGERGRFYSLISIFPPEQRDKLAQAYRELKQEVLRVRLFNDSFANYLVAARTLTEDFLEAAFPNQWGKLYSRQGKTLPSSMQSMMLNQHV